MTFYTYMWLREDGTPYYVGKGFGKRAFREGTASIFLQYWADEAEAFEMERYYIRLFGRKDIGTGILRNFTDGGEGHSNPSEKTRAKLVQHGKNIGSVSGERWGRWSIESGHLASLQTRENAVKAGRARALSFTLEQQQQAAKASHAVQKMKRTGLYSRTVKIQGNKVSTHNRWHVKRNIVSPTCALCRAGRLHNGA